MADNPWEEARARTENAAAQADQEESMFGEAGVGGAIALMAAGMLAPAAARKGMRAGIKAANRGMMSGKRGIGTKAVEEGRQKLRAGAREQRNRRLEQEHRARQKGTASGGASSQRRRQQQRERQARETSGEQDVPEPPRVTRADERAALDNMGGLDRFKAATARAGERRIRDGGRIDLTKYVSDLGARGAEGVQQRGQAFRQFRKSDVVKEKGMMKALAESKDQRKLISSAVSQNFGVESPQFFAGAYAIDSHMGITGGEDRAFYDVQGHAQDFAEYVPLYAGLEAGGVGAMAIAGTAKRALGNMPSPLEGKAHVAEAIGSAFDSFSRGTQALAELGEEGSARLTRIQARESGRAEGLMNQVKGFARGKKDEYDAFLEGRGGSRGEYDLMQISDNVKSLDVLFGDGQGGLSRAWRETLSKDNTEELLGAVRNKLFSEEGTQAQSIMGRIFGAKRVKIKDIDESKLDDRTRDILTKARGRQKEFHEKMHRLEEQGEISSEVREITDQFDVDQMDLDGFGDIGGTITRMPHNEEITQAGYQMASGVRVRMPTAKRGQGGQISVANVLGLDAFGTRTASLRELQGGITMQRTRQARSPDGKVIKGETEDTTDLLRFGREGELDHDARIKRGIDMQDNYEAGFAVKTGEGFKRSRMFGVRDDEVSVIGDAFLSGRSRGKMYRSQARRATPDEYYGRSQRQRVHAEGSPDDQREGLLGALKRSMNLGAHEGSVFTRIDDMMGAGSPRRLFSEDSKLWSTDFRPGEMTADEELLGADSLNVIRQAGINATDSGAYTNREVFQHAVDELNIQGAVKDAGGIDKVLTNSRAAATVADQVLKKHTQHLDEAVQAPTTAHAKKILGDFKQDPHSIHNPSGERRGDVLRRFVFEQGALGTSDPVTGMRNVDSETARGAMRNITRTLDDMEKKGRLDTDTVREAKVGLMGLDMQRLNGGRFREPYSQVGAGGDKALVSKATTADAFDHMKENKDLLTQFAASRPRMDVRYNRDAYTAKDNFHKSFTDTGEFAVQDPGIGMAKAFIESGLDTSRRALDLVGIGWSPNTSLTSTEGFNEFSKTMLSRGAGIVGGAMALRAGDLAAEATIGTAAEATGLNLPMKDGVVQELADITANVHLGASKLYDVFGVTTMAQYMEGLAPGSVTTVAGAAVGGVAGGGVLGAVAGATLGKVVQPMLTNTPFEALSILPPLAPFVSDMAEPYESVRDKYKGRKWIPQRSGQFYLLSGTPYEGENIEQYRPNWYVQQSSDYQQTSVQYGSALEEALFKDLPLIGFAPGDLVDPQYLDKKHAADRPFAEPSRPFTEVPFFGAILGKYVGGAYNALHPLGTNDPISPNVGDGGAVGTSEAPSPGGVGVPGAGVAGEYAADAMVEGTGEHHARAALDETFYNTTQALGMSGFLLRETAGGKGIFRDERVRSADDIDDVGRAFHDMQLGDLLGAGEAARRIQPFDRGGREARGPRNTMAEWMPKNLRYGDPFCVLPDTLMEAGSALRPAEEVYEAVNNGADIEARTHRGRRRRIEAAAVREVDEEIVEIHVEGLPWPLTVTKEHPVRVQEGEIDAQGDKWVLAGEVAKDPESYHILEPSVPRRYDHSGQRIKSILMLRRIAPPPGDTYSTRNLTPSEEHTLNVGFGLEGSPYNQRRSKEVTELRREIADYGFPEELIGAPAAALQPVVLSLAEVKTDKTSRYLEIVLDEDFFHQHNDARVRKAYQSPYSMEERLRHAALRLTRMLTAVSASAEVTKTDEGYRFVLRGVQASRFLTTKYQRAQSVRQAKPWQGHRLPHYRKQGTYRKVKEVVVRTYKGPVYAFQVEGDESFTAAGLATHNSKVEMGEALMPGEGLESTGILTGGEAPLEARNLGADDYETAMRQLDLAGKTSDSWAKQSVKEQLLDSGTAIRTEASYVDEQTGLTAVADAATKSNAPILLETLSEEEFRQTRDLREMDRRRLNLAMGAAKSNEGVFGYVEESTGQVQVFGGEFDQDQYQQDIGRLERGREAAYEYQDQGYGARGALYSTTDRMQVLMNADPFSQEYRREERRAQKMYHAGQLSMEERNQFETIVGQQREMRKPFEMHQKRFSGDKELLNPTDDFVNLSYNENVQAATNYSLPERAVGAMWEQFTSLRSPFHTKVFGQYSPEEEYERRVLLERDFQDWGSPYEDFVRPYMTGLASANDPVQGAASFGLGGLLFGNPAAGAVGAAAGAVYGAGRGAYEAMGGDRHIGSHIQEAREVNSMMDRVEYMRGQTLYEQTGDRRYEQAMQETAIGWSQAGMNEEGWAKERRDQYSPMTRFESRLYAQDQGFSSPYGGLKKVRGFLDAIGRKHDDQIINLTSRSVKLRNEVGARMPVPYNTRTADPRRRQKIRHENITREVEGMSGSGFAKLLRSENTQIQSGLGFGSPYRGEDPEAAVNWHGSDPTFDVLPPEMLTAYSAMPSKERDFFRPFAMTQDAGAQDRILEMTSPQMASMLETSWNYLHDRENTGRGLQHQDGMRASMTSHPVMGGYADTDAHTIRTAERQGMNADDVGLGWKGAMERLEGSMVEPAAIESVADITAQATAEVSASELQQMLHKALLQAGIVADVDVQEINGPSEIHIRDEL